MAAAYFEAFGTARALARFMSGHRVTGGFWQRSA